MDQTDPARDPLRGLAEAALTRQEAGQRQRTDDQAAVDRDQQTRPRPPTRPRPSPRPNSWPPKCSGLSAPSWPQA